MWGVVSGGSDGTAFCPTAWSPKLESVTLNVFRKERRLILKFTTSLPVLRFELQTDTELGLSPEVSRVSSEQKRLPFDSQHIIKSLSIFCNRSDRSAEFQTWEPRTIQRVPQPV